MDLFNCTEGLAADNKKYRPCYCSRKWPMNEFLSAHYYQLISTQLDSLIHALRLYPTFSWHYHSFKSSRKKMNSCSYLGASLSFRTKFSRDDFLVLVGELWHAHTHTSARILWNLWHENNALEVSSLFNREFAEGKKSSTSSRNIFRFFFFFLLLHLRIENFWCKIQPYSWHTVDLRLFE